MNSLLRVLHVEDDIRDAELVQATLEGEGIQSDLMRIETEPDFVAALNRGDIDLILADYTLPSFDGLSALKIAQQRVPEVPFLFVSGTLGEDVAIEALKTGATDYVLKTRLGRLAPSVKRALREARDKEERGRAEEAARRSEGELRDLIENAATMMFVASPGLSNTFVSRGWREYTGLSKEDTRGSGWQSAIHPEDLERHLEKFRACSAKGESFEDESRFRRAADGEYRWFLVRAVPLRDEAGDIVKWHGVLTDIEERKRAESLLAGERHLLEMIATGVALKEILNELCLIIEEQRAGTLASVLLLNPDGVHLDVIAGPNLPGDWNVEMERLPVGPCAGSCGTSAYRRALVIACDIESDPLWEDPGHRAVALEHGLRASWSSPVLSSEGEVLGIFCMYYREARTPTSQDLGLIELATHIARVAIERGRAEEALRASEQLARSHVEVIVGSLDVLATQASPEKFICEMLRTIGKNLRASRVGLWLRDEQDDSLRLYLSVENDQQAAPDPDHPFVKNPQDWKKQTALIQEMLFTKSPVVSDDIERDSRLAPEFRAYLVSRGTRRFMTVPMFVSGELRGFIGIHDAEKGAYRHEVEFAQALAHHVILATHRQELVEQQRQAAILKERTRMARDIHDTLAQGFTGVVLQMEAAEEALLEEDTAQALPHVRRARELARESLGEARRSVHALRPQALEKAAFAEALKAIIKNTTAGTSLRTDFKLEGEPRPLHPAIEENLLHIGQEALTNALKHARATKFQTSVTFESDALRLELRDNGDGFFVDQPNGSGIGLIGMKERAEQIGATLSVSSKPGAGTKIIAVSRYQS